VLTERKITCSPVCLSVQTMLGTIARKIELLVEFQEAHPEATFSGKGELASELEHGGCGDLAQSRGRDVRRARCGLGERRRVGREYRLLAKVHSPPKL